LILSYGTFSGILPGARRRVNNNRELVQAQGKDEIVKKTLLIGATIIVACSVCNRSDGDRLARVAGKVTQKIQELLPERTPLTGSFALTSGVNLDNRVRDRFKTDRYLAPLPIDIDVNVSTVRLRGPVNDEVLKRRAVEIAESTVGVEKVVDEIVVTK
jgi:hypothetical protein